MLCQPTATAPCIIQNRNPPPSLPPFLTSCLASCSFPLLPFPSPPLPFPPPALSPRLPSPPFLPSPPLPLSRLALHLPAPPPLFSLPAYLTHCLHSPALQITTLLVGQQLLSCCCGHRRTSIQGPGARSLNSRPRVRLRAAPALTVRSPARQRPGGCRGACAEVSAEARQLCQPPVVGRLSCPAVDLGDNGSRADVRRGALPAQ